MTDRGIFKTRLARPDKGGLRGKLTEEELEKVLATYVKGRLSPGPDGIISELLKDVTSTTRTLSDTHVNILSASVTTSRERIAVSRFTFEMADPKHLGSVLKAVRSVEGVYDAYRV